MDKCINECSVCFQGGYAAYRYTQPATATAYSDRYEFTRALLIFRSETQLSCRNLNENPSSKEQEKSQMFLIDRKEMRWRLLLRIH